MSTKTMDALARRIQVVVTARVKVPCCRAPQCTALFIPFESSWRFQKVGTPVDSITSLPFDYYRQHSISDGRQITFTTSVTLLLDRFWLNRASRSSPVSRFCTGPSNMSSARVYGPNVDGAVDLRHGGSLLIPSRQAVLKVAMTRTLGFPVQAWDESERRLSHV